MDRLGRPGGSPFNSMTLPYTAPTPVEIASTRPTTPAQRTPGVAKKRRYRPIRSCLPCHERKLQCDRAHPCKKCTDRRTTEQCIYRPPIPPSLRHLAHSRSQSESEQGENEASDGPASEAEFQRTSAPVQSTQSATAAQQQLVNAILAVGHLLSQKGSKTEAKPAGDVQNPREFIEELSKDFPDAEQTAWLLKHFFDDSPVLLLWPILHKTTFHRTQAQAELSPTANTALLAIVCLLSLQSLPEPVTDAALSSEYEARSREDVKSKLYEFASSLLSSFELLTQPKPGDIKSLLLFSIYLAEIILEHFGHRVRRVLVADLISVRQLQVGNAIRMAQLAQVHQHAVVNTAEPSTAEFVRILWWSLFLLDRYQCYLFQRPYLILEQHCRTPKPEAIHYFADRGGRLSDALVDNGFLLVQIQWAQIAGNVWDVYSSVNSTTRDLLCLEKTFHDLESGLPPPFRMPDVSETGCRGATYFQGLILTFRTYHIRARMLLKLQTKHLHHLPQNDRLQGVWDSVSETCTQLCQKILANLHLAQHTLPPSFLHWGELSLMTFEAALFLAAGVAVETGVPEQRLVKSLSWISIAESLLEKAPFHDFQARRSLKAFDTLRNAVLAAMHTASGLQLAPHFEVNSEDVISAAALIPPAVIDRLLPDDILGSVLPPTIGCPEVDLLNDENFVGRVQVFLDSCAAPR